MALTLYIHTYVNVSLSFLFYVNMCMYRSADHCDLLHCVSLRPFLSALILCFLVVHFDCVIRVIYTPFVIFDYQHRLTK